MQQRRADDTEHEYEHEHEHEHEELTTKEARQAVSGQKVRYVLFTSAGLTILAFIIIYAIFA